MRELFKCSATIFIIMYSCCFCTFFHKRGMLKWTVLHLYIYIYSTHVYYAIKIFAKRQWQCERSNKISIKCYRIIKHLAKYHIEFYQWPNMLSTDFFMLYSHMNKLVNKSIEFNELTYCMLRVQSTITTLIYRNILLTCYLKRGYVSKT